MPDEPQFRFEISLSVLNHLGRSLYRSFATVLGESISNSWDADAKNVWIDVDKRSNVFTIKDDGVGMTARDFQGKFLKIGYSKRRDGSKKSPKGRPFIGRKGIGKLALLSCSERITVVSKVKGGDYIGGVIDNSGLDAAIKDDLTPNQYPLGEWDTTALRAYTERHAHGTIIRFEGVKKGIKSSFDFLARIIALYFRFTLLDPTFEIFLNGKRITHEELDGLAGSTQFLWIIGHLDDPYVTALKRDFERESDQHEIRQISAGKGVVGFIASVSKPGDLKIMTTEERLGIDLFVNGRLRERDILKHVPTARVTENYLYGQVHFNGLDDATDRFTSSREGIVADDPKYVQFLARLRKTVLEIVEDWDRWRIKHREPGDSDNPRLTRKERASRGLFDEVSREFEPPKGAAGHDKVNNWVDALSSDAMYNFESYADCFVSENLLRKYIKDRKVVISPEAAAEAAEWRKREKQSKNRGNISIQIRRINEDASYLAMDNLAYLVDKPRDAANEAALVRDAKEYKPMRDAVAHTSLLTDVAKKRLNGVRENIKGRLRDILGKKP